MLLTHTSPARFGPQGGAVLLLHGENLPYREALLREVVVLVGRAECPIIPGRSDPRGSFLACGPVPTQNSSGQTTSIPTPMPISLVLPGGTFGCADCKLAYDTDLHADGSLVLSHGRGAAGDVVTIIGVRDWHLLRDSHGHHEQVTATVGGVDALPRHPSSSAVHRVAAQSSAAALIDGDGHWVVELALPSLPAGAHDLKLSIDRIWHDEPEVHGAVLLDGAPTASVTVVPSVTELVTHPGSRGNTRTLLVHGTGFSPRDTAAHEVRVDGVACKVLSASESLLDCHCDAGTLVDGSADALVPGASITDVAKRTATPQAGPGLTLHEQPLVTEDSECAHSLKIGRQTARCADVSWGAMRVALRQQLVFPHHTIERHTVEANRHLSERVQHGPVHVRADAWVTPPVDGLYAFDAEHGSEDRAGGAAGTHHMPCALHLNPRPEEERADAGDASERDGSGQGLSCSTGAVALKRGQRYRFSLEAIVGSLEQIAVRATVQVDQPLAKPTDAPPRDNSSSADRIIHLAAAPAEWFEDRLEPLAPATTGAPAPRVVSVHVNGLHAYCRAVDSCTIPNVADADDVESQPKRLAAVYNAAVDSLVNATWNSAEPLTATPARDAETMLELLPLLKASASVSTTNHAGRRLQSTCSDGACCVVLFRGPRGSKCSPVPVWDFSTWTHPGNVPVSRTSHRLCNSVRYSWLSRSGQHALQSDPEDITATHLLGGATRLGEFIDPVCAMASGSNYTRIVERWSVLSSYMGVGENDDVVLPRGASWLLDTNMTVRSLKIMGTLRWDTSTDDLVLNAGYVLVERGGVFELGTYEQPMLLRATIYLRKTNATHPYLGSRFLAIDGLASSAIDTTSVLTPSTNPLITIFVTLPLDVEPGQMFSVSHGGQVCADASPAARPPLTPATYCSRPRYAPWSVQNTLVQVPQDVAAGQLFPVQVPRPHPDDAPFPPPISPPAPAPPPVQASDLAKPRLDIHGRKLERTWTLLARTAVEGISQLLLKHDAPDMGWHVGDRISIATTRRHTAHNATIVGMGLGGEWHVEEDVAIASSTGSWSSPSRAYDRNDNTFWATRSDYQPGGLITNEWLYARLSQPSLLTRIDVPTQETQTQGDPLPCLSLISSCVRSLVWT